MSTGKELLISCIVMMHVFSQAFELDQFREYIREAELSLCNLQKAETDYVKHIFNGVPPSNSTLRETPEGITLPVGNTTEEIQTSVCAITDYLDNHIREIIGNLTLQYRDDLINNIQIFHSQFKAAFDLSGGQDDPGVLKRCHTSIATTHGYERKEAGLRILNATGRWVQSFANISCVLG